jgi:hypothetical protein
MLIKNKVIKKCVLWLKITVALVLYNSPITAHNKLRKSISSNKKTEVQNISKIKFH